MPTAHPALAAFSCAASVTNKPDPQRNEDAVAVIRPRHGRWHGLALADGLGSAACAREAARFVVMTVCKELEERDRVKSLPHLFQSVQERLRRYVVGHAGGAAEVRGPAWATTLIVVLETEQTLILAYAGNGAIWHIRPEFSQFQGQVGLPWHCLNLLNPHSVPRRGVEALSRVISGDGGPPVQPSVLHLDKDRVMGDLVLICTDGLYSHDQALCGADSEGRLWTRTEESMTRLYSLLSAQFSRPEPSSECAVQQSLERYLADLKEDGLLEDDASLGLLATSAALSYLQSCRREIA